MNELGQNDSIRESSRSVKSIHEDETRVIKHVKNCFAKMFKSGRAIQGLYLSLGK